MVIVWLPRVVAPLIVCVTPLPKEAGFIVIVPSALVVSSLPVKVVAAARSSRFPPLKYRVFELVPKAPATVATRVPAVRSKPPVNVLAPERVSGEVPLF